MENEQEKDEEDSEEDEENEEEIDESEEEFEPLETIIQETPVAKYPQISRNQEIVPSLKAEPFPQQDASLETGLQDIPTQTPIENAPIAKNEPVYSSDIYKNVESQAETGYPEQIHTGPQGFSPSLPGHLLQSQFDTIPRTIQTNRMPDELTQIRPQEKKYETDFEQRTKDRRRF